MKENFPPSLKKVLVHEGGWADHPKDPGGATMKGVTIGTFAAFKGRKVSKAELRAITDAEIAAIYKGGYWDKVRADDLPHGVDYATFDPAVNSGPKRGAMWLQRAARVPADGRVGRVTIEAARKADPVRLVSEICAVRMGFLRGLRTWGTFGKGWSRRVADVEAVGVAMAAKGAGLNVKAVTTAKSNDAASRARAEAQGAGAGGVAGTGVTGLADMPQWGLIAAGVAVVVLVVILMGQRRHNLARAKAFREITIKGEV